MSKPSQGMIWLWVVPLLLFTTWLGIQGLQADMIWSDEHWTLTIVGAAHYGSSAPVEVVWRAAADPWHPPLFYVLLGGWGSLVGWTPAAMRSLPLLLGVLAVAWVYRLGCDVASPRVGVMAAILVGSSSLLAIYLHELRQYSLFALTTTVGIWAYWRFVTMSRPTNTARFWLFAGVALQVYSHYFSFLTIAAMGLYHLIFVKRDRHWAEAIGFTVAGGATILVWVPVILQALQYTSDGGRNEATLFTSGDFLPYAIHAFGNGIGQIIFLPLLLIGILATRTVGWRFVVWVLVCMAIFSLTANAIQPVLAHVRYTIALLPLLMVLAAMGLERLWQLNRLLPMVLLIIWMGTSLYNVVVPTYDDDVYRDRFSAVFRPRLPLHDLSANLQAETFASDAIVYYTPRHAWAVSGTLDFYLHAQPARYIMLSELAADGEDDLDRLPARAEDFVVGAGRVWFVVEETWEPDSRLSLFEAVLAAKGFDFCRTDDSLRDLRIRLYVEHAIYCDVSQAPFVVFGDAIHLTGVNTAVDDSQLMLYTTWQTTDDVPADTYSLALYWENASGDIVQQVDIMFPMGEFAYNTQIFDVSDWEAEEYFAYAVVYDWRTGVRLSIDGAEDNRAFITMIDLDEF